MQQVNYVYSWIRTDLSQTQQIIQSAHSALEAGREFGTPATVSHLVLLQASSEATLKEVAEYLAECNIKFHLFFEPDDDLGYTSITTEPIDKCQRKIFNHFKLYKGESK